MNRSLIAPFVRFLSRRSAGVVVVAAVAALSGCPPPEEQPPPDNTISPACTEPTEVVCRDANTEQTLDMNPNDVTAGVITDEDKGDRFHAHIDASVGGIGGTGYVYAKFTDTGLERVDITDDESFDSMDWDIAFHRFVIRLNSGTGGPSCVTAARTAPDTDFASLDSVDDNLEFHAEAFMSQDGCTIIPDGSGIGAPGTVLQNFWEYSTQQCLQMTGFVYVVELADGHHIKLTVTNFYDDAAQAECQTDGTLAASHQSAQIQLDWAPLD